MKGGLKMLFFNGFFENDKEFDYEQLPNIIQEEFIVENLFKI